MSDYLWDPSADADPEVEEFEEALSAIRYRPGTPELPARLENALRVRRPKRLRWLLAAAAALAFVLLASGLWLSGRPDRGRTIYTQQAAGGSENSSPLGPGSKGIAAAPRGGEADRFVEKAQVGKLRRDVGSRGPARKRGEANAGGNMTGTRPPTRPPAAPAAGSDLSVSEAGGEAAKAQIMLALQITSSKLGLAQRLAQKSAVP